MNLLNLPLFKEAAGRFNTVTGPPADFPLRVLYSCAPPGHKQATIVAMAAQDLWA